MRGYDTIFQYVGIFIKTIVWNFYEVFHRWESLCGTSCGGGFYMVPLAYDNCMVPRLGAGIPAQSDAIDVCISKHQSVLIGGDGDSQLHRRAAGRGHRTPSR